MLLLHQRTVQVAEKAAAELFVLSRTSSTAWTCQIMPS